MFNHLNVSHLAASSLWCDSDWPTNPLITWGALKLWGLKHSLLITAQLLYLDIPRSTLCSILVYLSYAEIVTLNALIVFNAMNWPGGAFFLFGMQVLHQLPIADGDMAYVKVKTMKPQIKAFIWHFCTKLTSRSFRLLKPVMVSCEFSFPLEAILFFAETFKTPQCQFLKCQISVICENLE